MLCLVGPLLEHAILVAAVGSIEVNFLFPTDLHGSEPSAVPVRRIALARHAATARGNVETVDFGRKFLIERIDVGRVGDVGAVAAALRGVAHPSRSGADVPVFVDFLVVGEQEVEIHLGGVVATLVVRTEVVHRSRCEGRGIASALFLVFVVVEIESGLQRQAVDDVEQAVESAVDAVVAIGSPVLLQEPVGVVLAGVHVGVVHHRPRECGHVVLADEAVVGLHVVALRVGEPSALGKRVVVAIILHIDIARSRVEVVNRVSDRAAADAVARLRLHVVDGGVQRQSVPDFIGLAEGEGVAVVAVRLDESERMAVGYGNVGLNQVRTARHRHRVVRCHARAIEVFHVVVAVVAQVHLALVGNLVRGSRQCPHGRLADASAPAVGLAEIALCIHGGTIRVLDFRQQQRRVESDVARVADREFSGLAFLRRNHDDAVGRPRTVERGGVGTLQHVHRLDVVGVDHRQRVGTLGVGVFRHVVGVVDLAARVVGHGHTVDDDERRRTRQNRLVTAQLNARGTAGTARRGRDDHARHLSFERVGHVHVLHLHQVFGLHLLRGVGERLFLAQNTHCRHHHLGDVVARLGLQADAEGRGRRGRRFKWLVADVGDHDACPGRRDGQREASVDVGDGLRVAVFDGDGGSDERFARLINHRSCHGSSRVLGCRVCREKRAGK